jgi:hypothetical protein
MATVAVQRGHCFRKTGATGGRGEQQLANEVGTRLKNELTRLGHKVHLLGADDPVPHGLDVFVALHSDGTATNPQSRHGASVGYNTEGGRRIAQAWKRWHQLAGYKWGYLPDNYTVALHHYYGFGLSDAKFEFLAEHGQHSNDEEYRWLHSNYDLIARAHVNAIGELVGHPKPPGDVVSDPTPSTTVMSAGLCFAPDGAMGVFTADEIGGIFTEGAAIYKGSLPELGIKPNGPIVKILVWSHDGYTLLGADGGIFNFGSAPQISPYTPFFKEYRDGARHMVDAAIIGAVVIAVANDGGRYTLTA